MRTDQVLEKRQRERNIGYHHSKLATYHGYKIWNNLDNTDTQY